MPITAVVPIMNAEKINGVKNGGVYENVSIRKRTEKPSVFYFIKDV